MMETPATVGGTAALTENLGDGSPDTLDLHQAFS
jgi:hypothetical protein